MARNVFDDLRSPNLERVIDLGLNHFTSVPPTLVDYRTTLPVQNLTVGVKQVLHHYFVAKYGDTALDCGIYEYQQRLTDGPDWRFRERGIGVDKEAKRNVSNELAKGFARWFLHDHLAFTYFCPFEDLLGRINADGTRWTRATSGDLPDYVCGQDSSDVNLLETKGRYSPVTFKSKEFSEFRAQVQRAQLLGGNDIPIQVKAFISVVRWATEEKPRVRAKLLVEDPMTAGQPPGRDGFSTQVGRAMVFGHYALILSRLRLPLHADAIRSGRPVESATGARRGIWQCIAGPLKGRRFVGGLLVHSHDVACALPWLFFEGFPLTHVLRALQVSSPFLLASPAQFFGLEEHIMRAVAGAIRRDMAASAEIERVDLPERPGSLSLLRDGTVLGPAEYFEPIGIFEM
jgi:hypothetical protein